MKNQSLKFLNALLLMFLIASFMGCSKKDTAPGSLNIKVSYFYNTFQGYKADVGAKAYLFDWSKGQEAFIDSISPIAARTGILIDKKGDFVECLYKYNGEADVTGSINIPNVDAGSYLLVVASKGRWTFSSKQIDIQPGQTMSLIKNFYYLHDWEYGGEVW